jgi:branched-subunit amino acid aminotransferase/4-amino-4-deoxychorismate lyase
MPAKSLAYHNGQWLPSSEVRVALNDYGFILGATVVERLRTFRGKPYRVAEHLARLRRSLEIVGWNVVAIATEIESAVEEFMDRNAEFLTSGDDWNLIAFVTPGRTFDGSQPTVCVHGMPIPFGDWAHQYDDGAEAAIVDVRQTPSNCWPAEMKCRSRMHYYLADREAAARCRGARALLLDQNGFIAEASTANVVAYYPDRGLVGPRSGNILPGVSQLALNEVAATIGLVVVESDLAPEELVKASEIYLLSTSICMLPIVRVLYGENGDAQIGDGQPGPVYRQLLDAWSDAVGVDIAAQAQRFAER